MGKWSHQKRRTRLQVPFDQDVLDALSEFADVTGRTRPSIIEEIVIEAIPALTTMTRAMSQFDTDKTGSLRQMAEMMYRAAEEARQMGLELDQEGDR